MNKDIQTIDAKGLQCPKPLILTRKQLLEKPDSNFIIIVDNITAKNNIQRYLSDNYVSFSTTLNSENYFIEVNSRLTPTINKDNVETCGVHLKENSGLENDIEKDYGYDKQKETVICIKSNKMGEGDRELGMILLKAFISTIKEVSPLPSALILYNSGVKLTTDNSDMFNELKKLELSGVKIIICGTCTDYYNITDQISIGTISNMFEIIEILNNSDKIIYP